VYENLPRLDFAVVREPPDYLAEAIANKMQREWPANVARHSASPMVVRLLVTVSENTYRTIRYFCADKPEDGARKLHYALTAPPLVRTLLDALFTVVFLFEDLPERTSWYVRAGWREMEQKRIRFAKAYGDDPKWAEYLREYGNLVSSDQKLWGITEADAAQLKQIKFWPTPAQMINACQSAERREFLEYLHDWHYREMSQDSHLSWPGLWRRGGYFLSAKPSDELRDVLQKFKSDNLSMTVILLLSLLSEVQMELGLGLGERAKYIWGILCPYAGEAEEVYRQRYQERL
jgi:hypothetical protein